MRRAYVELPQRHHCKKVKKFQNLNLRLLSTSRVIASILSAEIGATCADNSRNVCQKATSSCSESFGCAPALIISRVSFSSSSLPFSAVKANMSCASSMALARCGLPRTAGVTACSEGVGWSAVGADPTPSARVSVVACPSTAFLSSGTDFSDIIAP